MRFSALFLITLFLFPSVVSAESASTQLKIHVDGNSTVILESQTQASSSSETTSKRETNINVEHSGEGTSEVTVNGEKRVYEGEGSWSVHEETSEASSSLDSTSNPDSTSSVSISSDASSSIVESQSVLEKIKDFFEDLAEKISEIF